MNIKSAAELWKALEHKFGATDAGHELYVMKKYLDFKMVENRSVVEQARVSTYCEGTRTAQTCFA
jgi:hypothetical protein